MKMDEDKTKDEAAHNNQNIGDENRTTDTSSESESSFDDDIISKINESLAQQINHEFEEDHSNENIKNPSIKKKKRMPPWLKVSLITFAVLLVAGFGYLYYLSSLINYDKGINTELKDETFDQDEDSLGLEEIDPNDIVWGVDNQYVRNDSDVINVLLVGEEAIGAGTGRGRTDSIMIATVNIKQKAIKLTSIMRDTYVQIPGYSDNKINAAYNIGGIPLLYSTIKLNFDIDLDGYVLVNFDGFEKVIDALGGVEITLTENEARYLNRTNYISNPAYRNVVAGTQILNGNQALGYSRVRYVKTGENLADDFGRTSRQRTVLNALFEKYKTKSAAELVLMLPDILQLITTDMSRTQIMQYIYTVITLGPDKLETMRIPVDGAYRGSRIRGMSVLLPDTLQDNIDALHEFIFGNEITDTSNMQPATTAPATY